MAALTLPDLSTLTGSRDGILGALGDVAKALPAAPGDVTAGLTGGTATLNASLQLDAGSLTRGVTQSLETLTKAVPSGAVPALEELTNGVARALGALDPARRALTHDDGSVRDLSSLVLEQAGDPVARIKELLGPLTSAIPAEDIRTLETFLQAVASFESSIPAEAGDVAAFVAQGFLGLPSNHLAPARTALDGFLGGMASLAPQAQVDALKAAAAGLPAKFAAAESLVVALDPTSAAAFAPAVAAVTQLRDDLRAFAQQVAALANAMRTGLPSLDAGGFVASVEAALEAIPDIRVPETRDFVELAIGPFRLFNGLVDSLTPEQVAAQLRNARTLIEDRLFTDDVAELGKIVRAPFEAVGHAIEGLHLETIRDGYRTALAEVGEGVRTVTGALDTAQGALVSALEEAGKAVDLLTGAAGEVETALNKLASEVQGAAGSVSLDAFRTEALALVDALAHDVADLVETAAEALSTLHELIDRLGHIDLEDAGANAVDALGRVTEVLSSIDVTVLPDALLSELRTALTSLLDGISLQPVHDALTGVLADAPLDVLDDFTRTYEEILHQLDEFAPASLLEPLQEPFDALLRQLNDLRPGDLLGPVVAELEDARASLDALSPAKLLAPLATPLAEARTALDGIAPERLLAPLHEPYADVVALVDKLDGKALLDDFQTQLSAWLEQGLGGLSGLGGAFGDAAATRSVVDAIAKPVAEDFGFRPGDILVPVQELYEKLVALLDRVPIATVLAAIEQLREAFVGTLDALAPGNLRAHVHERFEGLLAAFDVAPGADLVLELSPRFVSLTLAVDGIDPARVAPAARADHAQLVSVTADLDPARALGPARSAIGALRASGLAAAGALDVSGLGPAHTKVAARVNRTLPDFLREPVTEESLRAHLDALNPKHLADEINKEFDELLAKVVGLVQAFTTELPAFFTSIEQRAARSLDAILRDAFEAVHTPLRTQLAALDPAALEADLEQEVYKPIRDALASLTPDAILGDAGITARYEAAKTALDGVIGSLRALQQSVAATFDAVVDDVLAVSPRQLEADLQQAYAPVASALGELDLGGISEDLRAQFQRLGEQVANVLQQVLDALKALVAAIPQGVEGVNAEVDLTVRA